MITDRGRVFGYATVWKYDLDCHLPDGFYRDTRVILPYYLWDQVQALEVVTLKYYQRKGHIEHMQPELRNNVLVRMEGYADPDQLGRAILDRIPEDPVSGKEF